MKKTQKKYWAAYSGKVLWVEPGDVGVEQDEGRLAIFETESQARNFAPHLKTTPIYITLVPKKRKP